MEGQEVPESDPYGVDGYLDEIGVWGEGHVDKNGDLRPEMVDDEIRNQISSVASRVRTLEIYKKAPSDLIDRYAEAAVDKLQKVFPESKRDLMSSFAKENKDENFQKYLYLFEKKE